MTLIEIFTIIIIHWWADFVMQDEKWALGKSKNWSDLLAHTTTYSFLWYFPILPWLNNFYICFIFVLITFISHTVTDYFTSRIVSKRFAKQYYGSSIPNFGAFTIIGIDQVLHYLQLFITYYYLKTLI